MHQSQNDPKLTLEEVQILGSKLLQLHGKLSEEPEYQKAFEDAVALGIGGKFEGTRLRSTYLERNVMPLFSRMQAMVYIMDQHVDQWCRDKEAQIEASALSPEQKDACAGSLLAFAELTHQTLSEAEQSIGQASHKRACAACAVA